MRAVGEGRLWDLTVSEPHIDVAAMTEEEVLRLLLAGLRAEERPPVPWSIDIDIRLSEELRGP